MVQGGGGTARGGRLRIAGRTPPCPLFRGLRDERQRERADSMTSVDLAIANPHT